MIDSPLDTPSPNASSPGAAPQPSAATQPAGSHSRAQALLEKARVGNGRGGVAKPAPMAAANAKIGTAGAAKLTGILAKAKTLGIKVIHVEVNIGKQVLRRKLGV